MTWFSLAKRRKDTPEGRLSLRSAADRRSQRDAGHALLWSLFAADPGTARDFVYRQVAEGEYLVVSQREPVFDSHVWDIRIKPYAPRLEQGRYYGFSLRVNPSVAVSRPQRATSRRVDILAQASREAAGPLSAADRENLIITWLDSKLRRHGASLIADRCRVARFDRLRMDRTGDNGVLTLAYVDVEGVLEVNDANVLYAALKTGIGRGRAFGLGLLLLRALPDETVPSPSATDSPRK